MTLLNKEEIWRSFRLYHDQLTAAEVNLIKDHFRVYCDGNNIIFESTPHQENAFDLFKTAWIMSAVFSK